MVHTFELAYKHHLQEKGVDFDRHLIYSDGCAKEFKSKIPFFYVCQDKVERAYFGSRHGKSACDALGGHVKNGATRYVATGKSIQSAQDLYNYGCSEMAKEVECCGPNKNHKSKVFFLIHHIDRPTLPKLAFLPGTQKLLNVKSGESGESGEVMYRKRACFCKPCLSGNYSKCVNQEYTGGWKCHKLIPSKQCSKVTEPKHDIMESDIATASTVKRK
jgi:hypothetical protein